MGVAAGMGVGLGLLAWTPPVYASSTSIIVEPIGGDVNMRTEAELVRSTQITADAFARITGDPSRPEAAGRLAGVEPVPDSSVLRITFEAGSAETARAGATAFAEAYLAGRAESARAAISAEIASVQRRLDEVRTQLGDVNTRIGQSPANSPELDALRATQASLSTQLAELSTRLGELQTTTVNAGRIVAEASLPTGPVRPERARYLGVAAALGALGGAALHLVRARWSSRIRRAEDLRRHHLEVLAEFDLSALTAAGGHHELNGRGFGRLRNEVDAALAAADRVLLVTGAAPGAASTLVAANLAAAFARSDNDVLLVGANVNELASAQRRIALSGIFDLADIPGLTDVLAGRTTLARAVQRAARVPRLSVVTPGGTASAGGLLQSEGARSVLRQLATRTRYVIVDAPSTAAGADAQSLASAADAALLVVEAGHTAHAQVADAATQLERVGTRLLGAVIVPGRTDSTPYGSSTSDDRRDDRVPVAVPAYETEGWIGGRTDSLDGPTTKLDVVNRRPPARARAPHEQEPPASRDGAAPALD